MDKRHLWIAAVPLTALVALIAIILFITPASAAPVASATPAPLAAHNALPPPTDYLIVLPAIPSDPDSIPPNLTPDQATRYAHSLTHRYARPILAELQRLRAEGNIAGFKVQPDLHGVVVEGSTRQALEWLSTLPGTAATLPYKDELPACAAAAAQALPEQVLGLSRMAGSAATPRLQTTRLAPQVTDPSIDVYAPPGSTWTSVNGRTASNTTVTMRILRGGGVIATQSTTSDSSGYYHFYPSWQQCPYEGYNWTLRPGDVVEVTAGGNTVSTVVANLRAWVDPTANTVAGKTDPGRSAEVWVYDYGSNPCSSRSYNQTVGTDGSGNFSANFSSQVNFDRRASGDIYARDANGNSTYTWLYAYRISAEFDQTGFEGYLKPDVDFTATLSRTGSIVSTYSGTSSASNNNYYYGWFTDTIRPGDVIRVSGGGVSIQYTATSLDVTLNRATNQATGTTGANRVVQGWFYKRDLWYDVPTSCSYDSQCDYTIASSAGNFTLNAGLDLVRGDYVDLYVYDAEGNYQYPGNRPVPAIVADLAWGNVWGYWGDPSAGYVTVTLKTGDGTVEGINWWVAVDSWDGDFDAWGFNSIAPIDIVEVTDGVVTETMQVQNLSARLDGGSGHLTGNAYNGHLLAVLEDFRRESESSYSYCAETNVTGGTYNLTFSGAQVGGQDYAEVWSTGPDGHYTYRSSHTFAVNAVKESNSVQGYSETPDTAITITLKRGASTVSTCTTTSDSSGFYDGGFLSDSTPVDIVQGDTVQVQTGDGDSVSLSIPALTVNADAAHNRLYGTSPASEPVSPQARRRTRWGYYSYSQSTAADSSGNYSADFNSLYWWWNCSAVEVGHRCSQPAVYYYNAAGHNVWLRGPVPPPVGPDVYENDNVSTTAKTYAGVQSHTFHAVTDTDWIKFTVPASDVTHNVPYRIETLNLGWDMDTVLYLYDTDGSTELAYDDDGGVDLASRIDWTPPAAGTYYVLVEPLDEYSTAYCDAIYDLKVFPVRAQVFLPLVMRSY